MTEEMLQSSQKVVWELLPSCVRRWNPVEAEEDFTFYTVQKNNADPSLSPLFISLLLIAFFFSIWQRLILLSFSLLFTPSAQKRYLKQTQGPSFLFYYICFFSFYFRVVVDDVSSASCFVLGHQAVLHNDNNNYHYVTLDDSMTSLWINLQLIKPYSYSTFHTGPCSSKSFTTAGFLHFAVYTFWFSRSTAF